MNDPEFFKHNLHTQLTEEESILRIGGPLSSENSAYKEHQVLAMGFKYASIQNSPSAIALKTGLWIFWTATGVSSLGKYIRSTVCNSLGSKIPSS
ncbi:hypothetical protein NPIL_32801 [Nephila pilipes]|uniref:Uncharacterized protein n=1 Tax=Nephila pilipes TaxID=299642 RepID=A0A8X6N920_NEPPI|nr:hypothetical protein NPIL_32801 [Nephila pilipes]